MGKKWRWGVILDAGSSGTRLHVYQWKDPEKALKHASAEDLHSLPKLATEKEWTKKIRPGISTFGDKVEDVGPGHLQGLINHALKIIPEDKVQDTPIFLMATAGMRLLPKYQQTALTSEICSYLQQNTRFSLPDCDLHIQVIKGETEGLYGWIASNYLLGGFDHPDSHQHGKGHHTYGFLDMGGASAQIAFAPNATEAEKHANDLKLLRLRTLDGSPAEYRVFTTTWLGFGVNQARESYVQTLEDRYAAETNTELPDPCLPKGLRTSLHGDLIGDATPAVSTLIGTGQFDECMQLAYPLLGKDKPCEDNPCLINGQHVPAIDFDVNHFIGVSEYWHTTHGVFGGKGDEAYDFATYQQRVKDFCGQDWSAIKSSIGNHKIDKLRVAQEACFKASWLLNVLHEGIGVPRIGLEELRKANISKTALEHAKDRGFVDAFQAKDKIDGVEVSWTLGKMVLYAAGQITPISRDDRHPVGFGSNAEGTPSDFQFAGSTWRSFNHHGNNTSDDDGWDLDAEDILDKAKSKSTTGFFAFITILLLFLYIFRKRDRRMRVYSRVNAVLRRPRRSGGGGRKGSNPRGLSGLATKIFGGRPSGGAYERVMEEGEADRFELGDVDSSDDNEGSSDSSDGSRGSSRRLGLSSGLATPQITDHHYHHGLASPTVSALDRSGLVVRTESRDRLMLPPHLALSGAGRRSRAGSPTRMKSPLMSPLSEA
ncbi:nucleoside phosphatase family-domain-containing protein [Staphylotrichum tortipilum]|uniref:Nucleoside phosphatase family-domain-containing protein n=1 Tax=Staphylotrichum tortipilum TaxID=2831512 RepID=A0AAN6RWQ5_9PEZI|nr:nucleoside phosphatase family-domain-containing protein [Staphylotrichum longicolle]